VVAAAVRGAAGFGYWPPGWGRQVLAVPAAAGLGYWPLAWGRQVLAVWGAAGSGYGPPAWGRLIAASAAAAEEEEKEKEEELVALRIVRPAAVGGAGSTRCHPNSAGRSRLVGRRTSQAPWDWSPQVLSEVVDRLSSFSAIVMRVARTCRWRDHSARLVPLDRLCGRKRSAEKGEPDQSHRSSWHSKPY
jgi:hypothetical protein